MAFSTAAARASYSRCMTHEVDEFRSTLDGPRAGVLKKVAGLSDANARLTTVDSGTNLGGLLQHLTFVESKWFEGVVLGGKAKGKLFDAS